MQKFKMRKPNSPNRGRKTEQIQKSKTQKCKIRNSQTRSWNSRHAKSKSGSDLGALGVRFPPGLVFSSRNWCEFPKIAILAGCQKLAPTFWPRDVETRGRFLGVETAWKNEDEISRLILTHVVGSPSPHPTMIPHSSVIRYFGASLFYIIKNCQKWISTV